MGTSAAEESLLTPEFLKKLEALRLVVRRMRRSRAGGEHPAPAHGMSLEFTDYRKYNPGDDFRYIDWNVFSRLERLFLKIFTAEEDIMVHLFIDVSDSMGVGRPTKLTYAAKLAMAVSYVGITGYDRVGAISFSNGVEDAIPPVQGKPAISQLYRFFSGLRCAGETDFNRAMSQFAEGNRNPGLIFILSDMLDERGSSPGLELLLHGGNDVVVVHLLADEDLNPHPSGPLHLVDSESGRRKKVLADRELLDGYRRRFLRFADGVERNCIRQGIEYYRATTSLPVEQVVLRYLRKGRHLR